MHQRWRHLTKEGQGRGRCPPTGASVRDLQFVVAVGKGLPLKLSPGTPGEEGLSSSACRPQPLGRPSPRPARARRRDPGGIAAGRDRMSAEPVGTLPASGQRRGCRDCALSARRVRDAVSARPRARPPSRPPRAATSAPRSAPARPCRRLLPERAPRARAPGPRERAPPASYLRALLPPPPPRPSGWSQRGRGAEPAPDQLASPRPPGGGRALGPGRGRGRRAAGSVCPALTRDPHRVKAL